MSSRRDAPVVDRQAAALAGYPPGGEDGDDVIALRQRVAARLLAAGLDVHYALAMIDEGPAADRCASALNELRQAIRQVRRLPADHEQPGTTAGDDTADPGGRWPGGRGHRE
jgi:hypothetical protein